MSQRPFLHQLAWPMATGILVLALPSCGDKQKEARSELTAKAFTFTVDEYMRAAREGNVTALKHFVEAGMAVDVTDAEGSTALFRAAQAGRAEAVAFLASSGANLEVTGTGFDTPLVAAARTGTVETVKALLEAKADPAVHTKKNWTALTAAAFRGDSDLVRLLAPLSSGSLNEALQIASFQGKPEVVDALLKAGADVGSRSKDNMTPLMYAAANGHRDAVRILLMNGSNKFSIDDEKRTAGDLAMANNHPEIVSILDDPKLGPIIPAAVPGEALADTGPTDPSAPAANGGVVPGDVTTHPEAAVASATDAAEGPAFPADGSVAVTAPAGAGLGADDGGMTPTRAGQELARAQADAALAGSSPPAGPVGDEAALERAIAGQTGSPVPSRLQGARLQGLADGSTTAFKETVRLREFREGQIPILLEEVPAVGESARIRVLGRSGDAPEIVPAGGAIGDTGFELVRVERKFMNSKMGEGHLLDISHAIVRDRATGQRHIVKKNQAAHSAQATALISAGPDGVVYEVQEGDEFTAGDDSPARYKVLDVRPTQVVVENLETRETATLERSNAR